MLQKFWSALATKEKEFFGKSPARHHEVYCEFLKYIRAVNEAEKL